MNPATPLQTTVARPADAEGVGLHSGLPVRLRFTPSPEGGGVVFIRTDLPGRPSIPAVPEAINRQALERRTELVGEGGVTVATIEHLLAACLGMGLDHVRVEVDGPEIPIFDGSATPFVDLILQAGLADLKTPRRVWRLRRPVVLAKGKAEIAALPADAMRLAFFAQLTHAAIPNQAVAIELSPEAFQSELASARTFVFYEDLERLREAGLIRGGSLDCAIVLRDGRPIRGEYRMPKELARHKLLDLTGDLAILGRPVLALFTAHGSGHAMTHDFIDLLRKELFE